MGRYTDLLYARPTFLSGLARALDLGATLNEYNTSILGGEADRAALLADWYAVGDDMRQAIIAYDARLRQGRRDAGQR